MFRSLAALALVIAVSPSLAQEPVTLPGGASSLTETHGDWIVRCDVASQTAIACAVRQEQLDKATQQRLLAIEIIPAADDVSGTLVLPFGLSLERGVLLLVDDNMQMPNQRFATCLPGGCIVRLAIDPEVVVAMRNGKALNVVAVQDRGAEARFAISLAGLASALDRAAALTE